MMKDLLPHHIVKHKRPIKYLIAGGLAAFTDLSLLYFFTDILGVWYLFSAGLAFVAAFFVSFFLQKFWTFRDPDKQKMYQQMGAYLAVALANFAINVALMYALVDGLKIWYMLAQFVVGGLIAIESYLIYKTFIFNRNSKPANGKITPRNLTGLGAGAKVLIATGIYPPDIGGPATYGFFLKAELLKLGCEIKIITFGREDNADLPAEQAGFKENIIYVSRESNILARYFNFFRQVLRLADWADIIYTLDLISAGLPAVLAATFKGKKVVFRTGGDFLWEKAYQSGWTDLPLAVYYEAKKNLREKIFLSFCRWLLKRINLIIFSTEFQAKIYRQYYKLPEAKIKFVPNALPVMKAVSPSVAHRDAIIFAGRLIKLKNLERLISAFSKVKENNLRLVIFGQGPAKENLRNLINQLGQNKRIEIKGNVQHKELISFVSGCKFFILPSVTEISPNLALECLSLKKPIILTQETGLSADLIKKIITVNPLSEDDIKLKIEYLLNEKNLNDYRISLEKLAIEPREWRQIAVEHLNIFKDLK